MIPQQIIIYFLGFLLVYIILTEKRETFVDFNASTNSIEVNNKIYQLKRNMHYGSKEIKSKRFDGKAGNINIPDDGTKFGDLIEECAKFCNNTDKCEAFAVKERNNKCTLLNIQLSDEPQHSGDEKEHTFILRKD